MIAIYIQACNMDMRDVITEGLFILTIKDKDDEEMPKPKSEWTAIENDKVQYLLVRMPKKFGIN
ncbi:hypothetical protein REPUB_Repub15cG0074600 [Reevesia pubescens]